MYMCIYIHIYIYIYTHTQDAENTGGVPLGGREAAAAAAAGSSGGSSEQQRALRALGAVLREDVAAQLASPVGNVVSLGEAQNHLNPPTRL